MEELDLSDRLRIAQRNFECDFAKIESLRTNYAEAKKLRPDNLEECISSLESSLKQSQLHTIISAIEEIIETILACLTQRRFTTAEALSRIALEHCTNVIYILEDKTTSRSRSFLLAYFDNAYARAKKWNQYAIEKDDKDVIATSSDRMSLVQAMRGWVVGLDDAEAWPDARRRLRLIGAEHFYHDVFAPASDSVHTLGEDAFNNWFFERTNEECDPKLIRGVLHAEKGSYAIYMSTNALGFYTEIVRNLVGSAGNEEAHQHATNLIESLNTLLSEFTTLSTATVDK